MDRFRRIRLLAASLLLLLAGSGAHAQCAMCGSATPYADPSPGRAYAGFAIAALVLLVPVFGMLAALGVYLWRLRGVPAGGPAPEPVDGAPGARVLS